MPDTAAPEPRLADSRARPVPRVPLTRQRPGTPLGELIAYEICRRAAVGFAKVFAGYRHHHRERVPAEGPLLIVANHQSFLDPPLVGGCVDWRQLDFLGRATLFHNPVFGRLIRSLHTVPVDQSRGDAGAMKEILRRLEQGRAVVIFPEGSRSETGAVAPFKRGVTLLLKRSRCPVLPAAIDGAIDVWPRGAKTPRLFKGVIETTYGFPIPHDELLADGPDAALDRLQREVQQLRGELHASIRARTRGRRPSSPPPGLTADVDPGAAPATPPR